MKIAKNVWVRFLMFFGGVLGMSFVSFGQGLFPTTDFFQGTSSGQIQVVSFGDSIASGYDAADIWSIIFGGPYGDHFGQWLSAATGQSVNVSNLAYAGYTMSQILGKITGEYTGNIQTADIVFLEGGGNDLLELLGNNKINMCDPKSYTQPLENIRTNGLASINTILQYKKPGAKVGIMGFYYPLVNTLRQSPCYTSFLPGITPLPPKALQTSRDYSQVHELFLDVLAGINWEYRQAAFDNGFSFVDVFAKMNCASENESTCRIDNFASEEDYRQGIHSFDAQGILQDMGDLGYAQEDDIHPNTVGHEQIKRAILAR